MDISDPIKTRDASQIAVGGCLISAPLALFAAARWALKSAEAKEHDLAHQVEEVDIEIKESDDATGAHRIPPEESLKRFITTLRRITAPFDKMSARFEPSNHQQELKRLQSLKQRFEEEETPPSAEAKKMLLEAEQTLARYAPQ